MDPLTALRKQTEAKQAERAEVVPVATAVPLPAGYASAPAAVAVATTVTAPEKAAPSASAVPAAPAEAVPPPALASFLAPAATVATSSSPGSGASPPRPTFEGTLAGEHVVEQVKSCSLLVQNPFCEVAGRLQMTPYRLKFMIPKGSLRKELQWMREAKYFDVPFGAVESAKEETSTSTAGQTVYKLTITTKDLRVLCFFMPTDAEMRLVSEAVAAFGCPGNPAMLFATKHFEALKKEGALELEVPDSGWCFYDPIQDSARMGIDTELIPNPQCPWRVSELNRHYRLCSSYPSVLVLPRRMPDQALREVAAFRKRGRLPALSWCGGPELGFASLWRCSQTTEGLMGQKCIEDQAMLNAIRLGAGSKDRDLLLIDLRPRMNAWVNKAGGGGFEAYPNCRVIFGGIENIHAVRDAWRAMGAAVRNIVEGQVGSWFKDVANSGWYDYIGAILGSTLKVVEEILNNQANVVIHCSDGWDRTAQVSSLVMLCLDPYYRTQEGFLKLVQKEWCSFGHRFRTRLAIGEQPTAEYSPVFIQWLECVFQLQQQFPDTFEFAPPVLIRLADEVFSNRYGTFFCDNEQERRKVEKQTLSLWTTLLDEREMWRSTSYRPGRTQMLPSLCQANYTIWEAYWFRFHPRGAAAGGEPPSPTKKAEAADPFAPTFLGPASTASATSAPPSLAEPSPVNAEVEAVAAPSPEPSAPAKEGSLFSTAELAAPKKPSPAVALFTDDDEDVFATKPKVPEAEREAAAVRDA